MLDSNVYDSLLDWNKPRIVRIENKIRDQLHNIKTNIMQIGKLLSDAKKILSHGKYKPWIEEIFGDELPYSTAYCYKKIYEELMDHPATVKVLPLTFLIHMTHSSFPDIIKKLINDNPEAFKQSDINKISDAFEAYKRNEIDLDEFKQQTKDQIQKGISIIEKDQIERINRNSKRSDLHCLKNSFRRINNNMQHFRKYFYILDQKGEINDSLYCEVIGDIEETIKGFQKLKDEINKHKDDKSNN